MVFAKVAVANTYPITRDTDYCHPDVPDASSIPNAVCRFDFRHPLPFNEDTRRFGDQRQRQDKALEPGFDSHFVAVRPPGCNAVDDVRDSDYYELVLGEPSQV